jgi:RNA polymerase sigma factor (TIGR02999 family)
MEEREPEAPGEVTRLLAAARAGDSGAAGHLFELVYGDLHRLAARRMKDAAHGPSTTSLVHDAFLRLTRHGALPYADRRHFFAVASRAMRQIVIDDARTRQARKRGSGAHEVEIGELDVAAPAGAASIEELLALDAALEKLERAEPRLAETVEWHFFAGLTFAEIAEAREVSERTVLRDWRAARALLHLELGAAS